MLFYSSSPKSWWVRSNLNFFNFWTSKQQEQEVKASMTCDRMWGNTEEATKISTTKECPLLKMRHCNEKRKTAIFGLKWPRRSNRRSSGPTFLGSLYNFYFINIFDPTCPSPLNRRLRSFAASTSTALVARPKPQNKKLCQLSHGTNVIL
jgi:hypothetical protein